MSLNVLELYSGIGGMHYALEESGIKYQIVAAIDINPVCNAVYKYNFPDTNLVTKCLTSISVSEFDNYSADMIVMSPPCQPFTEIGNKKDINDERTKSFLYLLDLLPKLRKCPLFILMENVKGMERSIVRDKFVDVLNKLNYTFQEFILDPIQFGIPNSRKRFYLLAKHNPLKFAFSVQSEIRHNLPEDYELKYSDHLKPQLAEIFCSNMFPQQPLKSFLESQSPEYFKDFILPKKLYKKFWLMDLVSETSKSCCCFTKGYGRYVEKSGSIFQMNESETDLFPYKNHESDEIFIKEIEKLGLRFFTPREIANFMCFPKSFSFPNDLSILQRYRVLGNSLNVLVLTHLIRILCI